MQNKNSPPKKNPEEKKEEEKTKTNADLFEKHEEEVLETQGEGENDPLLRKSAGR